MEHGHPPSAFYKLAKLDQVRIVARLRATGRLGAPVDETDLTPVHEFAESVEVADGARDFWARQLAQ